MQKEKYDQIERENKILLEKMQKIYCKDKEGSSLSTKLRVPELEYLSTMSKQSNMKYRMNERNKEIMHKNLIMLDRLQNKKSNYNIEKWQREEEER